MTIPRVDWHDRAICKDMPVRDADTRFFPSSSRNKEAVAAAARICRHCPVHVACREFGRTQEYGIWGGEWAGDTKTRRRGGQQILAVGARRRLIALAVDGFGPVQVAEMLSAATGYDEPVWQIEHIRLGTRQRIPVDMHDAIADLYMRLDGIKSHSDYGHIVARNARNKNWPGRAAWHGLDIDDPKVSPR